MSAGKVGRWLVVAASVAVTVTVIAAMAVMGSPSAQREARLDQKRERDLDRIVAAVDDYVKRNKLLPRNLDILVGQPGRRLSITDPVDGLPYTYEITGDRAYRLCAVFATDTAKATDYANRWVDEEWLHGVGRRCFDRKPKTKDD
ncbi:MAG TPA: hypothetical protein VIT22_01400 [Pseudoxanthomonas sp.]